MKTSSPNNLAPIRVLCLAGPSLLAIIYFAFFAHPVYQTQARFFTGNSPAHSEKDRAAILEAVLFSPNFIEQADRDLNLGEHFSQASSDFRFRFPTGTAPDYLHSYFRKMVDLRTSTESSMLELNVRAFSPEFTKTFAEYLLSASEAALGRVQTDTTDPSVLIVITRPHTPQIPLIPRPFRGTLTVFVLSCLLYGIGRMLLATIRDHTV